MSFQVQRKSELPANDPRDGWIPVDRCDSLARAELLATRLVRARIVTPGGVRIVYQDDAAGAVLATPEPGLLDGARILRLLAAAG